MEREELFKMAEEYLKQAWESKDEKMKINRLVLAAGFYIHAGDLGNALSCQMALSQMGWPEEQGDAKELCYKTVEPMIKLEDELRKDEEKEMRNWFESQFNE